MEISSGEPSAKISKRNKWVKETADAHMLFCEIAKHDISNTGLDDVVFEKEKEKCVAQTQKHARNTTPSDLSV